MAWYSSTSSVKASVPVVYAVSPWVTFRTPRARDDRGGWSTTSTVAEAEAAPAPSSSVAALAVFVISVPLTVSTTTAWKYMGGDSLPGTVPRFHVIVLLSGL